MNFLKRKEPTMPIHQSLDLDAMEREITELAKDARNHSPEIEPVQYAPPHIRQVPALPLPAYVEHGPDVDPVGRLSSEAIVQQFEATAKAVETMATDLKLLINKLEERKLEAVEALKYVEDTAQAYRDEGKRVFERIQSQSMMIADVRKTCEDLRKRIENPEA